jgi:hypothetical protein
VMLVNFSLIWYLLFYLFCCACELAYFTVLIKLINKPLKP